MITHNIKHPAKFNDLLLDEIAKLVDKYHFNSIIDPFAGTGKIFKLLEYTPTLKVAAVELEPEWASMDHRAMVGNVLCLPFTDRSFDTVVTSPTFGNRLADHHVAKDGSIRHSYKFDLGRDLHPDNSGQLQWGDAYRQFHRLALVEMQRVAKWLVLDMADHVRGGKLMPVTAWWVETAQKMGYTVREWQHVRLPGLRQGRNGQQRVGFDSLIVFEGK